VKRIDPDNPYAGYNIKYIKAILNNNTPPKQPAFKSPQQLSKGN
jgi:hypothetical protein